MTVALMAVAVQAAMELLEPWPIKIALDVMIYMSWRFTSFGPLGARPIE